jgi:hypothetical protein
MANGDQFLAQGILQASQAIGQGIQQRALFTQKQKLQQQQLLQQKFDKLMKDRDTFFTLAGNKALPDTQRSNFFNMAVQINNAIGNVPIPGIQGDFGQAERDLSETMSFLFEQQKKGNISRAQLGQLQRAAASAATQQAETGEARAGVQQMLTQQQAQTFGTGTPTEITAGGRTGLARITPTSEPAFIEQPQPTQRPAQLAPKAQPAETAGRAASAVLGIQNINDAIDILFPTGTKGAADPIARFTAAFPAAFPRTQGKRASELLDAAIEAKLRADTGATARIEEVDALKKQFGIQFFKDKPQQTLDKLLRLRFVLENSTFRMDPQGKIKVQPLERAGTAPAQPGGGLPAGIKIKNFKVK